MDEIIRFAKALSDPLVVRLLACLQREGELCICEIQEAFRVTRAQADRALLKLREIGLVTATTKRHWLSYRVSEQEEEFVKLLLVHFEQSLKWDDGLADAIPRLTRALGRRVEGYCRPNA